MLNQASSATTILEVNLVNAGLLTFYQTLSLTIGAEIGSTITGQLVAFNIANYAVLIVGIGFFINFFTNSKKWKRIGNTIVGLGIIFIGMKFMSELFEPIKYFKPFAYLMIKLENPLMGILTGIVFYFDSQIKRNYFRDINCFGNG